MSEIPEDRPLLSKLWYAIQTSQNRDEMRYVARYIYRSCTMNEFCNYCDRQHTCKQFRNWHECVNGITDYLMEKRHRGVDNHEKISET